MGKLFPESSGQVVTVFAPPGAGFRLRRLADPQLLLLLPRQIRNGCCTRTPTYAPLRWAKRASAHTLCQRSECADYYEANRVNVKDKEHLYKKLQAIVEHRYGTIKRQWGFSYIVTKQGINRTNCDVGLIFIAYNLMRLINISGQDILKEYLRILSPLFLTVFVFFRRKTSWLETFLFQGINGPARINLSLKSH